MNNDLLIAAAICSANQSEYERMADEQLNNLLTKFQELKAQTQSKSELIKIDIEIAKIKSALKKHADLRKSLLAIPVTCGLLLIFIFIFLICYHV